MARRHLPQGYSRELPRLAQGPSAGLPRAYDIALEAISHGDARLDAESLRRFITAYQQVTVPQTGGAVGDPDHASPCAHRESAPRRSQGRRWHGRSRSGRDLGRRDDGNRGAGSEEPDPGHRGHGALEPAHDVSISYRNSRAACRGRARPSPCLSPGSSNSSPSRA
jgi:hypothetical protein